MGFKDLHSFNLALLAKQCWRMIINPDSICARILKAKYFPSTDLLHAGPKNGASFTWQSIVAGLATFKRGFIWRIGSGENVNIWDDPWIPSSPDRKVITPRGHTVISRVVELIDPVTTQWDEQLIRDIFYPVDANRILQIPINFQAFDDFIAWHLTKHGKFSVKSAYMEQWSHKYRNHSLGDLMSSSTLQLAIWKQLWCLQVPRKIQIFCWRALRGIVPLKSVLANRHIPISGECPICNRDAEDMRHMPFQCDIARKLWTGLGLMDRINHAVLVDRSGSVVFEFLLLEPDSPLSIMPSLNYKEVIAATCWYLWWLRRCHTHHDSCPRLPHGLPQFCQLLLTV